MRLLNKPALRRALVLPAAAGIVMASAGLAAADAPQPSTITGNVVDNGNGTFTLTVQGTWEWPTHHSDCNTDRWGMGWAVDWNDPSDPGHAVKGGPTTGRPAVGDSSDDAVHFFANPPRCGTYSSASGFNSGDWGPISHTYNADPSGLQVCVVTYDLHGKPTDSAPKGSDLVADQNGDNSWANDQNAGGAQCKSFSVPPPNNLPVGGAVGGIAAAVLLGGALVWRTRRTRRPATVETTE